MEIANFLKNSSIDDAVENLNKLLINPVNQAQSFEVTPNNVFTTKTND